MFSVQQTLVDADGADSWFLLVDATDVNEEFLLSDFETWSPHSAYKTLLQMFEEPLRDLAADDGLKPRSV